MHITGEAWPYPTKTEMDMQLADPRSNVHLETATATLNSHNKYDVSSPALSVTRGTQTPFKSPALPVLHDYP
jgi:hypothetical protein